MKKTIAAMVAGLTLSMAPVAMAGPVALTGDVSVKYARETVADSPASSGMIYTFRLMGETELGAGWSLYARLGGQYASQPSLGDFNSAAYNTDDKSVLALDQFGLIHKTDKLVYKLGRQDAAVGTTALLYSRADTNIGKKQFVDGLSIAGKVGATEISVLAAREDNITGEFKNKVYAMRAGYSPVENLTWGLTLGRFQGETESTNHWAVDGNYIFGKSTLTAEYTKASSSTSNKAYAIIWNYAFDDKVSAAVTGFRVEEFGSMGGQSDFDADNRGVHYGMSYKLSEAAVIDVVYKSQRTISGGQNNSKLEATISHTF